MNIYEHCRRKIFGNHQPYAGFPVKDWAGTWYNDQAACRPVFKTAIEKANPHVLVEVGSFVGESTIFMAKYLKETKRDFVILCIDTWGGGIDHWEKVPEKLRFWFGRPSLYYQFIGNVIAKGCHDVILPIALDSINGARLLKLLNIVPDFVYVDASHEKGDVLRDYETYWNLLRPGGVMLVDDLTNYFPGVLHDWDVFTKSQPMTIEVVDEKGLLTKPL